MDASILAQIPSRLYQGGDCAFALDLPLCPAGEGWVVTFALKAPGVASLAKEATPDGDRHQVALTSEETAALALGRNIWQLWAVKDTTRTLLGSGWLPVEASLLDATADLDPRSRDERILDALEAALERLVQDDETEVEIGDRKLVLKDPAKVQELIAVYRARVRVQRGGSAFTLLPVRFR